MSQAPPDRGVRLDWNVMPRHVRGEVERWLGGKVLSAATQPTGFTPGVAARLNADDGRRVFCKAAGPEPNAHTPEMHRREIRVVTALPNALPVPQLMWSYDEGEGGWVVLVFEDVDGHHPQQPWRLTPRDRHEATKSCLEIAPYPPVQISGATSFHPYWTVAATKVDKMAVAFAGVIGTWALDCAMGHRQLWIGDNGTSTRKRRGWR